MHSIVSSHPMRPEPPIASRDANPSRRRSAVTRAGRIHRDGGVPWACGESVGGSVVIDSGGGVEAVAVAVVGGSGFGAATGVPPRKRVAMPSERFAGLSRGSSMTGSAFASRIRLPKPRPRAGFATRARSVLKMGLARQRESAGRGRGRLTCPTGPTGPTSRTGRTGGSFVD
jgi:hypothetical protein